jgi:putative FmdB family regulatory protein
MCGNPAIFGEPAESSMPIYEYECDKCGYAFEREQSISDPPVKTCPKCRSRKVTKLISRSSFVLKGGGWYADGYSDSKNDSSSTSDSKSGSSSSDQTSNDSGSDQKKKKSGSSGKKSKKGSSKSKKNAA